MEINKILIVISLLHTAQGIIASHSEPHLANSLDVARNISAEFHSGSSTSNSIPPSTHISSTINYWTSKPTQYTAPNTVLTTKYIPPCWTQTTPQTTRPTQTTTPRTPPNTILTTKYISPCWTQTTPFPFTPPTVATVTPRTTVYPELENFFCDKRNNFYSVPNECDTYIECKENIAKKHFCPEGLVYKPSTVWPAYPCVLSSEYQCLNGSIIQPARPNGQCPHEDGYYAVPDSDCSQYIVCEHGISTLMNCPRGLVFNVEKSICDWPINVPSCHPDALRDFTCPSVEDTDEDVIYKFRYYNSCSYYVACQRGYPRFLNCPGGRRFDVDQQTCVEESYVTNCDE